MSTPFDQHGMNHMITAIKMEMTPQGARRNPPEGDTLFMGGPTPTAANENELATFGLDKNWKIVFPSFDPANTQEGPLGYHVVITDGLTESIILSDGRLWKRDRHSPAILVFEDANIMVRISAKGRLLVRGLGPARHDQGFAIADDAIRARAVSKPGGIPVVSTIGSLVAVLDLRTMQETFAAAA